MALRRPFSFWFVKDTSLFLFCQENISSRKRIKITKRLRPHLIAEAPEVATVLVHAHRPERPPRRARKVRNDDRGVADHRNHRVSLVDLALADVPLRMGVHVPDRLEGAFPAALPQRGVPISVEGDRPGLISIWIEILRGPRFLDQCLRWKNGLLYDKKEQQ